MGSNIITVPVRLETYKDTLLYILGGKAKITVISNKTNHSFDFKLWKIANLHYKVYVKYAIYPKPTKKNPNPVPKFRGKCIGYIKGTKWFPRPDDTFQKAKVAWRWVWYALMRHTMPHKCCIYHHSTCRKCGLPIKAMKSMVAGIGPCCSAAERAKEGK